MVGIGEKLGGKKGKNQEIVREGITYDNPEKFYDGFSSEGNDEEIGRGKLSKVSVVTCKTTGSKYAAKQIYFDDDESRKFALREYDLLVGGKLNHKCFVKLHKAYMVRKYLILILDYVDGKTLLDHFAHKHSITEDDIAQTIKQLCECLDSLHQENHVHLDIRPTNIRVVGRDIKLLDYNSMRHLINKKSGAVVDVIGDTEFCAPEMLNFDPVLPASDMWSVAVITYILLSGISPFFYEDESQVLQTVQTVKYEFDPDAFSKISTEAKDFIKKCLIRAPEFRLTAAGALAHDWFDEKHASKRKAIAITAQDVMEETDARLLSEETEEYVEASFVYRTFEEEEFISPEESSEEEEGK